MYSNTLKYKVIRLSTFMLLSLGFVNKGYSADTAEFSPFFVNNVLPVSIGLGLPKTLSATPLARGQKTFALNFGIKSNANDAGSPVNLGSSSEILRLDGETYSLDVGLAYGLSKRWQIDAQVSYLLHSSGNFDRLIDSWHEFFGLNEGDRPLFERDQFEFLYSNGDVTESIDDSVSGISDLRIGAGYLLSQSKVANLMLRAGLSLPTGDADDLTGSDDVDADVGIYANGRGANKWQKFGWHANIGYLFIGDEQALGIATEDGAWFSSLGAYWSLNSNWIIKGQFDSHGAFFDSEIDELSDSATEVTLGFSYKSKSWGIFEIFFSEDISVNRAADFSFGITRKVSF